MLTALLFLKKRLNQSKNLLIKLFLIQFLNSQIITKMLVP